MIDNGTLALGIILILFCWVGGYLLVRWIWPQ
jgi:hypothetical protein